MSQRISHVDNIFRALGDPTRRRLLERLCHGPAAVSELAEPFEMALPSLLQHLSLLEEAGLVRSSKAGRVRTFQIVPKQLQLAETWLAKQRTLWERRLDQLDAYLLELKEKQP